MALDRQGTQQQRPGSPTVTPPGMRVYAKYVYIYILHQRYILKKGCPQWHIYPPFQDLVENCAISSEKVRYKHWRGRGAFIMRGQVKIFFVLDAKKYASHR